MAEFFPQLVMSSFANPARLVGALATCLSSMSAGRDNTCVVDQAVLSDLRRDNGAASA